MKEKKSDKASYYSELNSKQMAKSMAFFNESEDFDQDPDEPLTSDQVRSLMKKEKEEG